MFFICLTIWQILEYIGLKEMYWADVLLFMKDIMVPDYRALLAGDIPDNNQSSGQQTTAKTDLVNGEEDACLGAIRRIFERASEDPDKVIRDTCIE